MGHDALEINDAKNVINLSGRNESGKSSLIKAVKCAFSTRGEKVDLVRNGSDFAEIEIETDAGMKIKRRIRPTGSGDSLTVLKDDAELRSPQTILTSLFSSIQLNPLDFMDLSSEKALESILEAFPLPNVEALLVKKTGGRANITKKEPLDQIKEVIDQTMEDRRQMKKQSEGLKIQAKQLLEGVPGDFDPEEFAGVDMHMLVMNQKAAIAHNARVSGAAEYQNRLRSEIEILEKQLAGKKAELATLEAKNDGTLMDVSVTNEKIARLNEWSNQMAASKSAKDKLAAAEDLDDKIKRKTGGIEWLRGLPAQLLEENVLIDGIRIADGRLEVEAKSGEFVAFANASESARLFYAVKIAKAMSPEGGLKLILVDGGERMDAKRKAELEKLCLTEPGFQLIFAEVDNDELTINTN